MELSNTAAENGWKARAAAVYCQNMHLTTERAIVYFGTPVALLSTWKAQLAAKL